MPRYQNLKGSMNPFDNNRPVLNSSDRIRNKKSKYIYAAAKQKFQTKRRCTGKDIKYYKKGTVRSVANYKLQQDLARGNVLCEDCNDRGTLCGSTERVNLNKIEMGNNKVSEFWGGGGINADPTVVDDYVQTTGFPIIQSDISGVWDSASPPEVNKVDVSGALPGSDPSANMPYGYIKNLIKIPRNLDGAGITIDPSNILFPNDSCGFAPYLKHSNLKTYLTVSAIIPIHALNPFEANPGNCNDPSYNLFINRPAIMSKWWHAPPPNDKISPVLTGIIKSLCCKRNMHIKILTSPFIFASEGEFGLFDINIEVFQIRDYALLSNMINRKPFFTTFSFPPFFSGWEWGNLSPFLQTYTNQAEGDCIMWTWMIESIKMTQGTIEPSYNQTKYNATKQSYLSCLEDGTKKINFTKNTIKNKIVKGYCE